MDPSAPHDQYVIGVDFGVRSGRAVVVRVSDGAELGTASHDADAHPVSDPGWGSDPDWGSDSDSDPGEPGEWLTVLETAVPDAVADAGVNPAWVIGIGVAAPVSTANLGAVDWIVWQLSGGRLRPASAVDDASGQAAEYEIGRLGASSGGLTAEAAEWTGLPEGIAVAVGNLDAHATAAAARAVGEGRLLAILGASTTRHLVSSSRPVEVPGIRHGVDGGIVAGSTGYLAERAGPGDVLDWYVANQVPGSVVAAAEAAGRSVHRYLGELAFSEPVGAHGLIALDWHGGDRGRSPNTDLSGAVLGLTLATRSEQVYRALLESTAFGMRVIVDAFTGAGVPVEEVVLAGELREHARLAQTCSDVLRVPVSVIASDHGAALGAAIHGAVAAGAYPDVPAAADAMGGVRAEVVRPDDADADAYDELYAEYRMLHDHFGRGGNDVMHRLAALRREVLG